MLRMRLEAGSWRSTPNIFGACVPEGRLVPLVGGAARTPRAIPFSLLYSVSFGSGLPLKDPAPKEEGPLAPLCLLSLYC